MNKNEYVRRIERVALGATAELVVLAVADAAEAMRAPQEEWLKAESGPPRGFKLVAEHVKEGNHTSAQMSPLLRGINRVGMGTNLSKADSHQLWSLLAADCIVVRTFGKDKNISLELFDGKKKRAGC